MTATLHITNGDSTAELIRRAGMAGIVLPWRDVLHEGPVPGGLALAQLSRARAAYIAERGWGSFDEVLREFADRDRTLAGATTADRVVLWFEADLYDRLQLIQILDWFAVLPSCPALSLICIGEFPGVTRFIGLGQLTPDQLATLTSNERPVGEEQRWLARRAWRAFTAPDPTALEELLSEDTGALPFLAAALQRHLEQFPATTDGLSRTERQILEALAANDDHFSGLFVAVQAREERPFMGDATFWDYLGRLAAGPSPAIERADGQPFEPPRSAPESREQFLYPLRLTDAGRRVLGWEADWVRLNGIDRWLGGVHLLGPEAQWRWDPADRRLVRGTV